MSCCGCMVCYVWMLCLRTYVCMYVRMSVCMYVRMYATCACMTVWFVCVYVYKDMNVMYVRML